MNPTILFLPWDEPHNASARCRIYELAAWLSDRGWNVTVFPPVGGAVGRTLAAPGRARRFRRLIYRLLQIPIRLRQLGSIASYDVVVMQRELYPYGKPRMENRALESARAVIFDLDDALHLPPSHFRNRAHDLHEFGKAELIARRARAVVVSSAALEEWARRIAERVVRIPTAVDTELFQPVAVSENRGPLIVGWTGTAGNLAHLESIRPALEAAAEEIPFVLRVVGESPPAPWSRLRVEFVRWSLDGEAAQVPRFDVGLMPLVDSEYARAKAGYKALVYMACGVPPIVSPVGTNREILEDGAEGFFADSLEDWRARIVQILRDPALRLRLGRAARVRVVAERSIDVLFPRWEQLLRSVLDPEVP